MTIKIPKGVKQPIAKRKHIASLFRAILRAECRIDRDKEHMWVMGLTTAKTIKYIELAALGTLNHTLVSPREVFRLAIMQAVDSIILCHNHPSGSWRPSDEDLAVTDRLITAGEIIGIRVVDHVLIAGRYDESVYEILQLCKGGYPPGRVKGVEVVG